MKRHIPNIITLANQFCGIVASIFAFQSNFTMALIFVCAGALFDFCDGAAARLLKVSSPLGKELDSLADMITFGLVPGIVAFRLLSPLGETSQILPYLGFMITLFSAYRLANFNIDTRQTSTFIGVPTPANALFWLGLAASMAVPNAWCILGLALVFSLLLVSPFAMISLKFHNFKWSDNREKYIFLAGAAVIAGVLRLSALPAIIGWYVAFSLIFNLIIRKTIK